MGSLHVLTADYYPLAPVITEAFEESTTLVVEVDLTELDSPATLALIIERATLPGTTTIETVVSSETVAVIESRAAEAGLPAAALKRMKPWMVAVTLLGIELRKAGFEPSLGLDRHFFDKARTAGKPVIGLETPAFQIERFDGLPARLQEEMLLEALNDVDRQRQNAKRLADSWAVGDTTILEAILLNDVRQSPEIYDRLLTERNRQWLPLIERCFTSIPSLLRRRRARPIWSDRRDWSACLARRATGGTAVANAQLSDVTQ